MPRTRRETVIYDDKGIFAKAVIREITTWTLGELRIAAGTIPVDAKYDTSGYDSDGDRIILGDDTVVLRRERYFDTETEKEVRLIEKTEFRDVTRKEAVTTRTLEPIDG